MFKKLFVIALALLFFGAGTGHSQIVEKTSDLTGYVGFLSFEGFGSFEVDGVEVDLGGRETEFTLGARYAYHVNMYSTIEGSFGLGFPEGGKFYNYFVNYRYNIAMDNPKVVPFATGGVGAFTFSPDEGDGTTEMAINFGGGLLFFPQERVGVRVDVRDLVVFFEDNTTNNIEITGGVSYFFM